MPKCRHEKHAPSAGVPQVYYRPTDLLAHGSLLSGSYTLTLTLILTLTLTLTLTDLLARSSRLSGSRHPPYLPGRGDLIGYLRAVRVRVRPRARARVRVRVRVRVRLRVGVRVGVRVRVRVRGRGRVKVRVRVRGAPRVAAQRARPQRVQDGPPG